MFRFFAIIVTIAAVKVSAFVWWQKSKPNENCNLLEGYLHQPNPNSI